jgi:DNA invertase Pin-like site-specific DNA recombinase
MTVFGYARVSTGGQDLALQIEALKAAGCERIFEEKKSGAKSANRPQLARMMKFVSHGDVIVVTRLDRLARSSRDLLNLIHEVTEIGAGFRSLAETWCDTTSAHGRLLLTIMGGLFRLWPMTSGLASRPSGGRCTGQGKINPLHASRQALTPCKTKRFHANRPF